MSSQNDLLHLEQFFVALTTFLRAAGGICKMSKLAATGHVQTAWSQYQRSSALAHSIKMKQVILTRPNMYQIFNDSANQPHVRLVHHVDVPERSAAESVAKVIKLAAA